MVVTVEPEDTKDFSKEHGVLAGIAFKEASEQSAKQHGGGGQIAPAQRLTDFMSVKSSQEMPVVS